MQTQRCEKFILCFFVRTLTHFYHIFVVPSFGEETNEEGLRMAIRIRKARFYMFTMLCICAAAFLGKTTTLHAYNNGELKIAFLDVGQGDCMFLESEGKTMLIDGGKKAKGNYISNYLKEQGVERIDYIISTHDHEDHIGGLYQVLNDFPVGKIYRPIQRYTCDISNKVNNMIAEKEIDQFYPSPGTKLQFGSATIFFLAPESGSTYSSYNDCSLVVRVVNGRNSFLLTGDAEFQSENEMIGKGYELKSDVLKVGHHSALTSSSDAFIKAVNPAISVILCDSKSTSGFPRITTLRKLTNSNIYRTDQVGDITMISDGTTITVDKPAFSYAKSDIDILNGAVTGTDLKESELLKNPKVLSSYEDEGFQFQDISGEEDYDILITEPLDLNFTAECGISRLEKVEYALINAEENYDPETVEWKRAEDEFLCLNQDFVGCIYVRFTNQLGNQLVRKTKGFTMDVTVPENCTVTSNIEGLQLVDINAKNSYQKYSDTPPSFHFSADYGVSEDGTVEYMLAERGEGFNEDGDWITGDSVTIQDDFIGRIYVRYTDGAGHVRLLKTNGFTWIQGEPTNLQVKDSSGKVGLISYRSNSKKVIQIKKKTTLGFSADFGHGGKQSIQYQLVKTGKGKKSSGKWYYGNKVTLKKGFRGKVIVKFTDKAGYSVMKKTNIISVK